MQANAMKTVKNTENRIKAMAGTASSTELRKELEWLEFEKFCAKCVGAMF